MQVWNPRYHILEKYANSHPSGNGQEDRKRSG